MHHLRLFGRPYLVGPDGTRTPLRTGKQLALLVYLALEARTRPVSRDKLITLFWPGVPAENGRHSLSQALTAIRAKLGREAVTRAGPGVKLAPLLTTDLDTDSPEFICPRDLNNPLEDLEQHGGPAFSHWVDRVRERCRASIRSHLLDAVDMARASGQVTRVHEVAEQLYVIDPQNDVAVLALAEHHLLRGDTRGAIELLRRHIAVAAEELGRQVPKQVTRFLRRVERGLVSVAGFDCVREYGTSQVVPQREVFVGRDEELSRLEALWTRARDGGLVTCLVSGPAGIGKSTLVNRLATALLTRGWPVCLTTCQEMGCKIPFAAVSDLTYKLARDPGLGATDPQWLAEISRVTPGLRTLYPGIPEPNPAPAEAIRLRIADALFRMLTAVADGGAILLLLDDVQYMDPASREVIHLLARHLESTPTLVVGTVRSTGPARSMMGCEVSEVVDWQEELSLAAMEAESTRQMVICLSESDEIPEAVCDKMVDLSQGNPYLTEMLLSDWRNNCDDSLVSIELRDDRRSARWRPPDTMRKAFDRQYKGLSRDTEHVLHLLAVAERAIPVGEIENLLALAPGVADRAALELIERTIVRTSGGALGFRNQPHRAYVYYAMSDDARTYHHGRLARSLAATRQERDFQSALEAAPHYLKAGMTKEAVDAACLGADLAVTHGAPREAERALNAVLPVLTDAGTSQVYLLLARALVAEGRFQEALNALAHWEDDGSSPHQRALAATTRVQALHRGRLGDDRNISEALDEALALTDYSGDSGLLMRVLLLSAEIASEIGDTNTLASIRTKAAQAYGSSKRADTSGLAQLTKAYCLLASGDINGALPQFRQCLGVLRKRTLDVELRQGLNGLGIASYWLGQFDEAIEAFREATKIASRIGDSVASATSWSNLGAVNEDLGDLDQAEVCYRQALELQAVASNPRRAVEVHLNLASLQMLRGGTEDAMNCLAVAKQQARVAQLWWLETDVLMAEADLCIMVGDPESAWPLVEEGLTNTRGRIYLLADMGRTERLKRHYLWATQGLEAVRRLSMTEDLRQRCPALSRRLEVLAFEEWIEQAERQTHHVGGAVDELRRLGLNGVVQRLQAFQVLYQD